MAGRRAPRPGVDVAGALGLTGTLLMYLSLAALFPIAVAIGYDERFWPFIAAGASRAESGGLTDSTAARPPFGIREGFSSCR